MVEGLDPSAIAMNYQSEISQVSDEGQSAEDMINDPVKPDLDRKERFKALQARAVSFLLCESSISSFMSNLRSMTINVSNRNNPLNGIWKRQQLSHNDLRRIQTFLPRFREGKHLPLITC